jgi:hypothetical protein
VHGILYILEKSIDVNNIEFSALSFLLGERRFQCFVSMTPEMKEK